VNALPIIGSETYLPPCPMLHSEDITQKNEPQTFYLDANLFLCKKIGILILNFNSFVGVNQIIWNLLVVEGLTIARPWFPVKQNRILIPEVFTSPIC
jgi:hypothetical protein